MRFALHFALAMHRARGPAVIGEVPAVDSNFDLELVSYQLK
jgi:hypothetical protein